MILEVKVIPQAKQNLIKADGARFKVYLTAPAVEGKANKALIEFLAGHFNVKKAKIEIIKGLKSRQKTITIRGI